MARSISVIQKQILEEAAAKPQLAEMNSNSQVAIYRLWAFVVAVCINLFEQTVDIYKAALEAAVEKAAPGTPAYIQDKIFKFQYSATNPQVVTLVDFVPGYNIIDESLRIISRCSVKTDSNKIVNIKVAKSDPPTQLASAELTALDSYWSAYNFAGVGYNIISLPSDKLYVSANIYYNGQYAATIQADAIAGIKSYMETFSKKDFDGTIKLTSLVDAIQAVKGVTDVELLEVRGRKDSQTWANGTIVTRAYDTYSGYVEEENTGGKTFADSLVFIVENN